MKWRHVILDRDGVLNEEAPGGGYVRAASDWQWIPGSLEGLSLLTSAGIRLSIATNQAGIGRGLMTAADLESVHARMLREACDAGARIAAVFVCPHAPDEGCECRKPAPGLVREAIKASQVGPEQTLLVGDDVRDLEAAARAGISAALVLTGKGRTAVHRGVDGGVAVFEDLRSLTRALVESAVRGGEVRT